MQYAPYAATKRSQALAFEQAVWMQSNQNADIPADAAYLLLDFIAADGLLVRRTGKQTIGRPVLFLVINQNSQLVLASATNKLLSAWRDVNEAVDIHAL